MPPSPAEPGTIRGDLAVNIGHNVIHGSDATETAAFEIGLWFEASELNDWSPSDQSGASKADHSVFESIPSECPQQRLFG